MDVLPVLVVIRDIATGKTLQSRVVNHCDYLHRSWMGKVSHWAFRNNASMYTSPDTEGNGVGWIVRPDFP